MLASDIVAVDPKLSFDEIILVSQQNVTNKAWYKKQRTLLTNYTAPIKSSYNRIGGKLMTLYLFTFALLVLTITEALQGNKKMVLIGGGFLAVLAGFRYQTGYDFVSYKSFFDDMTGVRCL